MYYIPLIRYYHGREERIILKFIPPKQDNPWWERVVKVLLTPEKMDKIYGRKP